MLDSRRFAYVAGTFQLTLLLLYAFCADYSQQLRGDSTHVVGDQVDLTKTYGTFQDVHVMIFIGFGFLMTFLSKYSFGAVGFNFMLAAMAVQWGILLTGFWHNVDENDGSERHWETVKLDNVMLIRGDFGAAAVMITYGAVIGKTSPLQLVGILFFELFFYTMNEYIGISYLECQDVGGSMIIHAFGAYFGVAVALVLGRSSPVDKHDEMFHSKTSKVSDTFAMVGTLFLWLFWPSFNGALAPIDTQQRVFINTVLSLCGSCVGTFIFSQFMRRRFSMVDVQNATLAGGVAMGAIADMAIDPWAALLTGLCAAAVSVLGYTVLQPWLSEKIGLDDTCGVHNLHGMPGIIGGLAGTFAALNSTDDVYGSNLETIYPGRAHRSPGEQAGYQFLTLCITVGIALASGAFTAVIVQHEFFEPPHPRDFYSDHLYWDGEAAPKRASGSDFSTGARGDSPHGFPPVDKSADGDHVTVMMAGSVSGDTTTRAQCSTETQI